MEAALARELLMCISKDKAETSRNPRTGDNPFSEDVIEAVSLRLDNMNDSHMATKECRKGL